MVKRCRRTATPVSLHGLSGTSGYPTSSVLPRLSLFRGLGAPIRAGHGQPPGEGADQLGCPASREKASPIAPASETMRI
jgi:hypothetical protein